MTTAIIIPARYGSTRLPGKPLMQIAGKSMIQRVVEIAHSVQGVDVVAVATDDARIQAHVESFGGTAVMTREDAPNGTARVFEAAQKLAVRPDVVLNFQGDSPLTPPWIIAPVVAALQQNGVQVATPATRMTAESYAKLKAAKAGGEVGGTTVVCAENGDALYFSKSLIPFVRKIDAASRFPVLRHVGLYGYTFKALENYFAWGECELENVEGLEQLRFLYHGVPIRVMEVDYKGRSHWGVDSAEDAKRVEEYIAREGELPL
ncbi:MAG: 3-deoxy-manno-octulosonate cytidylyltransferase [Alphaproteobacteria bacterium]